MIRIRNVAQGYHARCANVSPRSAVCGVSLGWTSMILWSALSIVSILRQRQMQVEGRLVDKNSLGLFYKFVNKRTSNRTAVLAPSSVRTTSLLLTTMIRLAPSMISLRVLVDQIMVSCRRALTRQPTFWTLLMLMSSMFCVPSREWRVDFQVVLMVYLQYF